MANPPLALSVVGSLSAIKPPGRTTSLVFLILRQGESTGTGSRCRKKSILLEINENFPVTCQPQEKPREAGPDMGVAGLSSNGQAGTSRPGPQERKNRCAVIIGQTRGISLSASPSCRQASRSTSSGRSVFSTISRRTG